MAVVTSIKKNEENRDGLHKLCLFVQELPDEISMHDFKGSRALSVIVDDLLWAEGMYHMI